MKKILSCAAALVLLLSALIVPAQAKVDLESPRFVVDDSDVLSEELEQKLVETNQALELDCQGAQFVVVTVDYSPAGLDHEEYATKIFNTWKIGSFKRNNGTLLVIYTEEDDFWFEMGAGIFGTSAVEGIYAMMAPETDFDAAMTAHDYEKAVSILLTGLDEWYHMQYGAAAGDTRPRDEDPLLGTYFNTDPESHERRPAGHRGGMGVFWKILLILLLVAVVTSPLFCRRRFGRFGIWPLFYFSPWWRAFRAQRRTAPPRRAPGGYPGRQSYARPAPPNQSSSYRSTGDSSRYFQGGSSSDPSRYFQGSGSTSRPSGGGTRSFRSGPSHSSSRPAGKGSYGSSPRPTGGSRSFGGSRSSGGSFRSGGGRAGGGFGRR